MNRLTATTALGLSLALVCFAARACGEGQFNMGQGLRYQGYLAPRPATLLVYDDRAADHGALYAGLKKAGHKVTVVDSADAMAQALHAGHYDVVIADFEEAAALQSHAVGTSGKSGVLPVVARNRRNAPEVSSQFKLFLLDGASLGQYLKGINQLLSLRVK
jgi:CheY-like chemotaxis protein